MRNFLTFSYIALAIVFAGSVAAYMFASQSDIGWLQDLALNLGTEVAGIVLTIVSAASDPVSAPVKCPSKDVQGSSDPSARKVPS